MYIVTLSKSYVDLEFKFDDMEDAGKFIGMALETENKGADNEWKLIVTIKYINEEEF